MKMPEVFEKELKNKINNSTVFDISSYIDDNGEPFNVINGSYIRCENENTEFYVGGLHIILYNAVQIDYNSIDLYYFLGSDNEILISYDVSSDYVDENGVVDDLFLPYIQSEEEYFQYSTVDEHPLTWDELKKVNKFFDDCKKYEYNKRIRDYQEYLNSIDS